MKTWNTLLLAALLLITTSLLADGPARRTILLKDGKLLKDGAPFAIDLDGMLGGSRAWLGVSLTDLSPELREHFGAGDDAGVLVSAVADGSPAAKAGVRVGDVIVSLDGKDVESSWDLRRGLKDKKGGEAARLDVVRNRSRQSLVATVAERELKRLPEVLRLDDLSRSLGETFSSPEWRARIESLGDCDDLQSKIRDLESRLKELEKKLQK